MSARRAVSRIDPRSGEPRVYTVRELVGELRRLLEDDYPRVLVRGEITDCRRSTNGHVYFRLKDSDAQLQVALFAKQARTVPFELENGIAVQVEGQISVYPNRGDLQLIADRVQPVGFGALQAKFEALKRRLQAEGLFAPERKRPLPEHPTRVAIVTSFGGAALRDMIRILRQRAPYVLVTVAPTRVQGIGAAREIADAIALVNEWRKDDVLIVGRGGGSLEDLWAFNEELVVRAIAASRIPVVSAVGHEVDVTLADLVADVRAATPTHAAQQVAPDRGEVCRTLDRLRQHAYARLVRELERDRRHLESFRTHHAFHEPHRIIRAARQTLDLRQDRLTHALEGWAAKRRAAVAETEARIRAHAPERIVERMRERLLHLGQRVEGAATAAVTRRRAEVRGGARLLDSYDYRGVLRRGYALVWSEDGERLVHRAGSLRPDDRVRLQLPDGRADARVLSVETRPEQEAP